LHFNFVLILVNWVPLYGLRRWNMEYELIELLTNSKTQKL